MLLRSKEKHLLHMLSNIKIDTCIILTGFSLHVESTRFKLESTFQPSIIVGDFLHLILFNYLKNPCLVSVALKYFLSSSEAMVSLW